ncbi:MAG: transcriptional regulator [Chloroflexi bacterium]|nr:transcriptional regulator [Chloroflexota bacterium]MBV9600203.1 transcriptional regulator [Chloroflexota bacterium]
MRQPPRPIESRADLERTERWIWQLLDREPRTAAEEAYLSVLTTLVRAWEDAHVSIPMLEPRELVKALLEERGQRQKDLVPIFGTESIVSEVLAGKRRLQLDHVRGLAAFFNLPAAVFVGGDEASTPSAVPPSGTVAA